MLTGLFPFLLPRLSIHEFDALTETSHVLSQDEFGDKVLQLCDGSVMKLFRRKRFLTSNLILPYAVRFQRACDKLHSAGVRTVTVLRVARVPHIRRDVVVYEYLEGKSMRERMEQFLAGDANEDAKELWNKFNEFLKWLHDRGIFMRGMHLGNVVVDEQYQFGLVDVVDVFVRKKAICSFEREHNHQSIQEKDGELLRSLNILNTR